jgi:hypothetical protein
VLFYGVVSDSSSKALELFADHGEAELVVESWDRDEPERAGELYIEAVEIEAGSLN